MLNESARPSPARPFALPENSANGTAGRHGHEAIPTRATTPHLRITGGNTGGAFAIDPTTGAITVANAAALDFEADADLLADGAGHRRGRPHRRRDRHGEPEQLERGARRHRRDGFALPENSANGTAVGIVGPSRERPRPRGDTRTFAITGGNTGGAFAIDADDRRDHRRERRGARLRDDADLRAHRSGDRRAASRLAPRP